MLIVIQDYISNLQSLLANKAFYCPIYKLT